jgi:UDP-N-acetylglucosamine--N-acetylmuramyl-(pentapeptide) pyrophosphoryl-undecaprenol N-acetylglucosamine transferase
MAAGTGGHVLPALSIAHELQKRGFSVRWLGTPHGIEQTLVPKTHIPLDVISMTGIRGKGWRRLCQAPFDVMKATRQALHYFRQHKPIAVIGMGGFVAFPGGLAALLCRTPLFIHEQNAIPGLVNRLLAPWSKRRMVAFPNTLKKALHTGNPIRTDIQPTPESPSHILRLLVMGGSQGAVAINEAVIQLQIKYPSLPIQIQHQTGQKDFERVQTLCAEQELPAQISPFIHDMPEAYAWADVVLGRAGAMTVFEIATAGKASILVPYPHAVDDHQTANARYLSDVEGAILLPEPQLTADTLHDILQNFIRFPEKRLALAQHAQARATPHATEAVVNCCLEAVCS